MPTTKAARSARRLLGFPAFSRENQTRLPASPEVVSRFGNQTRLPASPEDVSKFGNQIRLPASPEDLSRFGNELRLPASEETITNQIRLPSSQKTTRSSALASSWPSARFMHSCHTGAHGWDRTSDISRHLRSSRLGGGEASEASHGARQCGLSSPRALLTTHRAPYPYRTSTELS